MGIILGQLDLGRVNGLCYFNNGKVCCALLAKRVLILLIKHLLHITFKSLERSDFGGLLFQWRSYLDGRIGGYTKRSVRGQHCSEGLLFTCRAELSMTTAGERPARSVSPAGLQMAE